MMYLLLPGACWILTLSLIACLCLAAREGDLEHDRPTSPGAGEPMRPTYGRLPSAAGRAERLKSS